MGAQKFFLAAQSLVQKKSRTNTSGHNQSGTCRGLSQPLETEEAAIRTEGQRRTAPTEENAKSQRGKRGRKQTCSLFSKRSETWREQQILNTFVMRPLNAMCGWPLHPDLAIYRSHTYPHTAGREGETISR